MDRSCIAALAAFAAAAGALAGYAKDVVLVDDGTAKCRIVVEAGTPPSAGFGAKEIAKYFGKTTGAKVEVADSGEGGGLYPIVVGVDAALPAEGFAIDVAEDGMKVSGADARGVLYGCYEVLKRWAGMRWLEQGDQGEYCVLRGRTIAAPVGRIAESPHLAVRGFWPEEPEE